MRMLRALAGATFFVSMAAAQATFDVASIRATAPRPGGRGMHDGFQERIRFSPGSLTMNGVTFRSCVRWAYGVVDYQVSGPDWIDSERYDIVAKAAGAEPEDRLRLMLQALLAERFQLAVHRQTKEMPAWVLSVGKNGPKFRESVGGGEASIEPNRQKMEIAVRNTPVSQLVDFLGGMLRAPIIDETGLKGRYDITIGVDKYIPDHATPITDMISVLMTGIQQELGLKLESHKMPVDLVVIDRAERTPAAN